MRGRLPKCRALADVVLIVVFVAMTGLPVVRNQFRPALSAANENRVLATRPALPFSRAELRTFPARFEAYYNDQFAGRGTLIRWLNRAKVEALHVSSSGQVCIGKKGWLFYTVEPTGADYQIMKPFTEAELLRWRRMLEARRDWLAARGIPYVFLVAPDKQSVYPEVLPRVLRCRSRPQTRLEQLVKYLEAHSDVRLLDVRKPLQAAKARDRVFLLTDSHWNDRGAFIAYQSLVERLNRWFPEMRALPPEAFAEFCHKGKGGDLARMLGLEDRLPEEEIGLAPRVPLHAHLVDPGFQVPSLPPEMQPVVMEGANPRLPRAVVFRDSFAGRLVPFLSEHFRRAVYLWQELYQFDAALVERERPDVVIQEIAERKLALPFPADCLAGIADRFDQQVEVRSACLGQGP